MFYVAAAAAFKQPEHDGGNDDDKPLWHTFYRRTLWVFDGKLGRVRCHVIYPLRIIPVKTKIVMDTTTTDLQRIPFSFYMIIILHNIYIRFNYIDSLVPYNRAPIYSRSRHIGSKSIYIQYKRLWCTKPSLWCCARGKCFFPLPSPILVYLNSLSLSFSLFIYIIHYVYRIRLSIMIDREA